MHEIKYFTPAFILYIEYNKAPRYPQIILNQPTEYVDSIH